MAEYVYKNYECRVLRATKLYANASDVGASNAEAKTGATFTSSVQYVNGNSIRYQIAKPTKGQAAMGYWIPSGSIEAKLTSPEDPLAGVTENKTSSFSGSGRSGSLDEGTSTKHGSKATKDADKRTALQSGDTVVAADGTSLALKEYSPDAVSEPINQTVSTTDNSPVTTEDAINYRELYLDSGTSLQGASIGRMTFVQGMPFQYDYITDRRLGSYHPDDARRVDVMARADKGNSGNSQIAHYGRTYSTDIAASVPVVVISPGKPRFLTRVNTGSNASKSVLEEFFPLFAGGDVANDTKLKLADIGGSYDYYTIDIDMYDYYLYVNSMCKLTAGLMGLEGTSGGTIQGVSPVDFDWGNFNTSASQDFTTWEEVVGLSGGVSYVYDPNGGVSDTISNSTGESQFASVFNELSSMSKEMDFILGYSGSSIDINNIGGVKEAQAKLSGGFMGMGNVVNNVMAWATNSAKGFNIRFPEIWQDSQFSRSYSIDMHFIAPYATAYCKWRYVIVPFIHIFSMAAPKSNVNNSQYESPLLVRVFSKGYFNVEMGIIESITWKRFGEGDMISEDGVPTQIDVSVQFKDMYHSLAMTSSGAAGANTINFLNNSGLMDLLGTLSGVNMNRMGPLDKISMFIDEARHGIVGLRGNVKRAISDKVRNVAGNLLRWR